MGKRNLQIAGRLVYRAVLSGPHIFLCISTGKSWHLGQWLLQVCRGVEVTYLEFPTVAHVQHCILSYFFALQWKVYAVVFVLFYWVLAYCCSVELCYTYFLRNSLFLWHHYFGESYRGIGQGSAMMLYGMGTKNEIFVLYNWWTVIIVFLRPY